MKARKRDRAWSGYKSCTLLWKAIQKYGVENIEERILFDAPMTKEESSRLEQICILLFKTDACIFNKPAYGYNLTSGGDGVSGNVPPEAEYNRRVKQMRQNALNCRGKKLSEEHRRKLSEKKKRELNPHWGKHLAEETKRKIGIANSRANMSEETRIRRSESKKKKVVATHKDSGEIIAFNSMYEAADYFGVRQSSITRWCRKQRNPCPPYTFDYLIANND